MNIDSNKAKEVFDDLLISMDDQIDWLIEEAEKHKINLTGSPSTPETLEKLFDLISKGMDEENTEKLMAIFGRYLGEFLRLNYGGKWTLPLEDKKKRKLQHSRDHRPLAYRRAGIRPHKSRTSLCASQERGDYTPSYRKSHSPANIGPKPRSSTGGQ